MSVMVLDSGNSIIKAKITRRQHGEIAFPHALRQLTESEYQKVVSRPSMNGNTKDYLRVNGVPYVVGKSAERHGVLTQRSGASRYTRDYYGVFAAISLARLYGRGREVAVFGSHPPGDVKYREDLMKSVIGEWEVETESSKANFRVIYANTFDEPVGGLMNVLLTEDGQHYQYVHVGEGRSLVVDIGGFTTDFLSVNPGKDTPVLPPDRIRIAIKAGVFEGGGRKYPCEQDVEEATSLFINRFADTYQRLAGGALLWDTIILTGGGSALLYHKLKPLLKHDNVMLVDSIDSLHMANVRGGMKLWRLYEELKVL